MSWFALTPVSELPPRSKDSETSTIPSLTILQSILKTSSEKIVATSKLAVLRHLVLRCGVSSIASMAVTRVASTIWQPDTPTEADCSSVSKSG